MENNDNPLSENNHNFSANNEMANPRAVQIFDDKVCKAPPTYDGSVEK